MSDKEKNIVIWNLINEKVNDSTLKYVNRYGEYQARLAMKAEWEKNIDNEFSRCPYSVNEYIKPDLDESKEKMEKWKEILKYASTIFITK